MVVPGGGGGGGGALGSGGAAGGGRGVRGPAAVLERAEELDEAAALGHGAEGRMSGGQFTRFPVVREFWEKEVGRCGGGVGICGGEPTTTSAALGFADRIGGVGDSARPGVGPVRRVSFA